MKKILNKIEYLLFKHRLTTMSSRYFFTHQFTHHFVEGIVNLCELLRTLYSGICNLISDL